MPKKSAKAKLKANKKKNKNKNNNKNNKQKTKPNDKQSKNAPKKDLVDEELNSTMDDPHIKEFIRDIHIHNLSVTPPCGGTALIRGSDVKLIHGHRYGLIGYNGAGKTTLLQKLDSGTIKDIPDYLRVHLVKQELDGTTRTVMQTVLDADKERTYLLDYEKKLTIAIEEAGQGTGITIPGSNNKPKPKEEEKELSNGTHNNSNNNTKQNGDTKKQINGNNNKKEETNGTKKEETNGNVKKEENGNKEENGKKDEKQEEKKEEKKQTKEHHDKSLDEFFDLQDKLQEVKDRLKFIEADTAETRASRVLSGLQFTDRMKNMNTADLSGGWRMRVRLAMALFIQPDLLMLDEPTNHLDFPSVLWLTDYLVDEYPLDKTIIIVSHDRRFLNDTCTDIIHLSRQKLYYYTGNYDNFISIRNQSRVHQSKQYERQQKMIKHNEEFIAKFKANKKWSTQAQSRQKLLAKTKRIEKVLTDMEFRFFFPEPKPLKNPNVISISDVSFGYFGEDKTKKSYLLKNINLRVQFGTKVGILGANGAGKSTLLRLIMNELKPLYGTAYLSNSADVGYFAQHHIETLDYEKTPLQLLKSIGPSGCTVEQCYKQLGRFQMGGKIANQKIKTLSGGQKSRVAFSILTWYSPHIVIMDEPTNNLDMPTVDALAMALCDFPGAVIVVSHDQHFVETVCDEYWAVGNRDVKVFENFEKCRHYTATSCKPFDVLPRKFSSINIKDKFKTKHTINDNLGILDKQFQLQKKEREEKLLKLKNKNKQKQKLEVHIDAEREIEKGLKKGLTPNKILMHLKGWIPTDNNLQVTHKLMFSIMHEYFDKKYDDISTFDYYEKWKSLMQFCILKEHTGNQSEMFNIIYSCWTTALKDKSPKAIGNYALGVIYETLFKLDILNPEAFKKWHNIKKDNKNDPIPFTKETINQFIITFDYIENGGNESDSDSDSDSD